MQQQPGDPGNNKSGASESSPNLDPPRRRPSSLAFKPVTPLFTTPPKRPAAAAFGGSFTNPNTGPADPSLIWSNTSPPSQSHPQPMGVPLSHQDPSQSHAQQPYQSHFGEQLEYGDQIVNQQTRNVYSNAYFSVPDAADTPKRKAGLDDTPQFDDNFAEQSPKPFFGQAPQYAQLGQHQRNDSRSQLLSPQPRLQHVNTPPPYGYANHLENRILVPFWQREWLLYLLFFLGIMGAIGHHFFYHSLHGKVAKDQRTMLRYGSLVSFIVKAALGSAALIAFRQRVWVSVRRKMLSLEAVDALFSATENISSMANTEAVSKAKMAMLLAFFTWATPLIVILASETLSIELATNEVYDKCPAIRTLNFTHEETQDWRTGIKVNGHYLISASLWNKTGTVADPWNPTQQDFDYFTEKSTQFEQVGVYSLYSGQAVARANASNEICGVGWNCSYSIEFIAPGYKCANVADGVGSEVKTVNGVESPLNFEHLLPTGNYSYAVHAFRGQYDSPQIFNVSNDPVQPGGIPPDFVRRPNGDWPKRLGAFRTEPIIWAGYAEPKDPKRGAILDPNDPDFQSFYTPKMIACEHYYTKYNVTIMYNSTLQTHKVTSREYLRRLIDTDYVGNTTRDDYINDNTTATPEENYIYPVDLYKYRHTAAYHSIGGVFREYINNTISFAGGSVIAESKAHSTRLIARKDYLVIPNFIEELPKVYEEMVLSLFFDPFFMAVSWAADPSSSTGDLSGTEPQLLYPCQKSRMDTVFHYHALNLWAVYGVAILLTAGAVTFGQLAVSENDGVVRDTKFSSIVAATRGNHLSGVDWALKDGRVSGAVKRIRVGYGVVHEAAISGLGIHQDPGYGFDRRRTLTSRGGGLDSPIGPMTMVPIFGFGVDGGVRQRRHQRNFTFRTPTLDGRDGFKRDGMAGNGS